MLSSIVLFILYSFDSVTHVLSHHKLIFRYVVIVLACGCSDEVVEHLIVTLSAVRVYLQVPVEELFVVRVWLIQEAFVVEGWLLIDLTDMFLIVQEQVNDQVEESISDLRDTLARLTYHLCIFDHGRLQFLDQGSL